MVNKELVLGALKRVPANIGTWFVAHESTLLPVAAEVSSGVAIFFAVKNSRFIMDTIDEARMALSHTGDPEERHQIYLATLKEIGPKVAPIAGFYGGSIALTVINKKQNDKKIADLTAALTLSQNALVQYQLWKKEAEKQIGKEKVEEVSKTVAQKEVDADPPTKENIKGSEKIIDGPAIKPIILWKDGNVSGRYLPSYKTDNDVERWCIEESAALSSLKYSMQGNKVTANDFYRFLSEGLDDDYAVPALDKVKEFAWYLTKEDARRGHCTDLINIDTYGATAKDGTPVMCFHMNFYPFPNDEEDLYTD